MDLVVALMDQWRHKAMPKVNSVVFIAHGKHLIKLQVYVLMV